MKICFFIGLLLAQIATAKDLRHFNSEVLGKSVNDSVVLLASSGTNAVEPTSVHVDIANGRYYGALIKFPESVTLEEVRESLNLIYKTHEKPNMVLKDQMGIWRIEDKKFVIQLSKDEDDNVQIIFLTFQPMDKILEKMGKAMEMIEREKAKEKKALRSPKDSK